MNLLRIVSRCLAIVVMALASNASAREWRKHADKVHAVLGSVLFNEKNMATIFGDKIISPRNQAVIGKALYGAAGNLIKDLDQNERQWKRFYMDVDMVPMVEGKRVCYQKCAGYVVVNGSLRFVGNYISLDEKSIDKKCDEVLPENVAWVVKPVANMLVDLAYDYVTVKAVKGILDGINKSN